jgi:hypothetical protein
MKAYIILVALLAFSGVALSDGLQELLNITKFITDIYQKIPSSCIFIVISEEEEQGENNSNSISHRFVKSFWERNTARTL